MGVIDRASCVNLSIHKTGSDSVVIINFCEMLEKPGDLIPVNVEATMVPWTKRRAQILDYLHRGPVTFNTLVYDTNVGDISTLISYFNPQRVSVNDLNTRLGSFPSSGPPRVETRKIGNENVVMPRLLLYSDQPEEPARDQQCIDMDLDSSWSSNISQRTRSWVMRGEGKDSEKTKAEADVSRDTLELQDFGLEWTENGREVVAGKICKDRLCTLRGRNSPDGYSGTSSELSLGLEALSLEVPTLASGGRVSECLEVHGANTEPDLAAALEVVTRALRQRSCAGPSSKPSHLLGG